MAQRLTTTPDPAFRRRLCAAPAVPLRRAASLPDHLAHLAPVLRSRSHIEALVEQLVDLLDALDAPLADMEPDHDGEAEPDETSLQPLANSGDRPSPQFWRKGDRPPSSVPTAANVIQFPGLYRPRITWPAVPLPESAE